MNKESEKLFLSAIELSQKNKSNEALILLRQAITIDAADSRYWISLGACLMELKHWAEAAKSLEKGISLNPAYGEADARMYLAEAFYKNGEKNKAKAQWKIVSTMEPEYPSYEEPIQEAQLKLKKLK